MLLTAFRLTALVAALGVFVIGPASAAATPAPKPLPTINVPKVPLHTEFVVQTNGKGQVVRVKSGKSCPNLAFNAMTYGNALQAFVRTADGRVVVGMYRLSYDYSPKTKKVHRGVELLSRGGDPNAESAVADMARKAKRRAELDAAQASPLPELSKIIKATPTPR